MTASQPPTLFVPILANDHSCANLRNAYVNSSNLWTVAAMMYYQAGMTNSFVIARRYAIMCAIASGCYGQIADLGDYLKSIHRH